MRSSSRLYKDYQFPLSVKDTSKYASPISSVPFQPQTLILPVRHADTSQETGTQGNRMFVARIPARVSEDEMRRYFEKFGLIEDVYRPKDIIKDTFRGFGFVTFEDPHVIDVIMASKHVLGGAEVIVDRARPKESNDVWKEEPMVSIDISSFSSLGSSSFDPSPLGSTPVSNMFLGSNGSHQDARRHISDDREALIGPQIETPKQKGSSDGTSGTMGEKDQRVTDNAAHVRRVRGGARIYVGRLSKRTVEQDLVDYFSQFGRVLDVYIPRSKGNKKHHRDFGFVTFDTEASMMRAVHVGAHFLKGTVVTTNVAFTDVSTN